jgi:hypothetical protein
MSESSNNQPRRGSSPPTVTNSQGGYKKRERSRDNGRQNYYKAPKYTSNNSNKGKWKDDRVSDKTYVQQKLDKIENNYGRIDFERYQKYKAYLTTRLFTGTQCILCCGMAHGVAVCPLKKKMLDDTVSYEQDDMAWLFVQEQMLFQKLVTYADGYAFAMEVWKKIVEAAKKRKTVDGMSSESSKRYKAIKEDSLL